MQPEDYEAFASIVEGLNLPDKALWKSNLEKELDESQYEDSVGFASALGPILISQLPSLKSVNLGSSWNKLSNRSVNTGTMFRSTLVPGPGNPHPSHFQKLERVEAYFPLYGYESPYRGNLLQNTQEAMSFFYLPALKDLTLLITNTYSQDGRSTFEWPGERPPPTKIRTLVLEALGEENLGDILSLTPKIQKLVWIHWYSNKVRGNFSSPVIDCDTVIEALSLVQDVLEDLTVQADLVYRDKQPVEDGDGVKGRLDLRNFDKLRKIEAPLILLLGIDQERAGKFADVLPRNVREVTINADYGLESLENLKWDPRLVIDTFRTWLADSRTVTPHLTRINVFWPAMEGAKELEELFSEARIQYVIYVDASDPPIYLNNYRMYPPADGQYDAEWEYGDIHLRLTNEVRLASILVKNSSEAVKQGLQDLTIS
jgi:hypothetical protein